MSKLFNIEYQKEYDIVGGAIIRYKRYGPRNDLIHYLYFSPYGKMLIRKKPPWYLILPEGMEELMFKIKLILAILHKSLPSMYWKKTQFPYWFSLDCWRILKNHFPEFFETTIRNIAIPRYPEEFFPPRFIKQWREKFNTVIILPTFYLDR